MDLNSSKQLIGILEGMDSCSVDQMLGFFSEVMREIERSMGDGQTADQLPVSDEKKIVENLVKFGQMIGRIYENNSELFSDSNAQRRWSRAEKKLTGLNSQLSVLEEQMKDYELLLKETQIREQKLSDYLKGKDNLEQQLKAKENLIRILEQKKEESETIEQAISKLEKSDIPIAEMKAKRLEQRRSELEKLKTGYEDQLVKEIQEQDRLVTVCANTRKQEEEALEKQKQLSDEIEGLETSKGEIEKKITELRNSMAAYQTAIERLENEACTESENCRKLEKEKKAAAEGADAIRTARIHLQQELNDKEKERQTEAAENTEVEKRIEQCKADIKNYISIRNGLLVDIDKLEQEIDQREEDYQKYSAKKGLLKNKIQDLRLEAAEWTKECHDLEISIETEEAQKLAILAEAEELRSRLKAIQSENESIFGKNSEFGKLVEEEKEQTTSLERTLAELEDQYAELKAGVEEKKQAIADVQADQESGQLAIASLEKELEEEKQRYQTSLEQIRELRREVTRRRFRTASVIKDYQKQVEADQDEQEWISGMINQLLNDEVLNKNWMNTGYLGLESQLKNHKTNLDNRIRSEMELLKELLRQLEGRNI